MLIQITEFMTKIFEERGAKFYSDECSKKLYLSLGGSLDDNYRKIGVIDGRCVIISHDNIDIITIDGSKLFKIGKDIFDDSSNIMFMDILVKKPVWIKYLVDYKDMIMFVASIVFGSADINDVLYKNKPKIKANGYAKEICDATIICVDD